MLQLQIEPTDVIYLNLQQGIEVNDATTGTEDGNNTPFREDSLHHPTPISPTFAA
jgi:hypothetical protein